MRPEQPVTLETTSSLAAFLFSCMPTMAMVLTSAVRRRPCWNPSRARRPASVQATLSRELWSLWQAHHHHNTETFSAVPWIIRNGGQAY